MRTIVLALALVAGVSGQHYDSTGVQSGMGGGAYKSGTSAVGDALAKNVHDVERAGDAYKWIKCYNMGKLYIPGTAKIELCDGGSPFDVPFKTGYTDAGVFDADEFQASVHKMKAAFDDVKPQFLAGTNIPKVYVPQCAAKSQFTFPTNTNWAWTPSVECTSAANNWIASHLPLLSQGAIAGSSYIPQRFVGAASSQLWGKPVWETEQGGYILNDKQIQLIENRLMKKSKLPWCAEVKGECGRETDEGLALGFYSAQRGCEAYCAGNDDIEWRYGSTFDSARVTNVEFLLGGMPNAPKDDAMHQCTCIAKYHEPHSSRTVVEFHDRYFNADYYAVPIREFTDMPDLRAFSDTGSQLHGALHTYDSAKMYTSGI